MFWLGALAVGAVSVLFASIANKSQGLFAALVAWDARLPLVVTPLVFVLGSYLTRRHFQGAQGSGIPQAIAARHLRDDASRRRLLSPKLILGKIAITALGLLGGGSIGREGPTVQVGAGLMLEAARLGRLRRERGLILAGSAAGIAGAFNTPLAGVVFAIEEMSRSFESRTNGLVLYAVIIAGLISLALVGDYTYFGVSSGVIAGAWDWAMTILCGVFGGLCGGLFSRLLLDVGRRLKSLTATLPRALGFAGACGLLIALVGMATNGATYGTGYEQARAAIEGHPPGAFFWIGKFVATLATGLSGLPGGIFAPSLAVGAGLGGWLGSLSPLASANAIGVAAVLGMAGYFAGVVQAPMTAFVIILEMTGSTSNALPLMVAAMLGFGASKLVAPEPLYHALAQDFIAEGERERHEASVAAPQSAT